MRRMPIARRKHTVEFLSGGGGECLERMLIAEATTNKGVEVDITVREPSGYYSRQCPFAVRLGGRNAQIRVCEEKRPYRL